MMDIGSCYRWTGSGPCALWQFDPVSEWVKIYKGDIVVPVSYTLLYGDRIYKVLLPSGVLAEFDPDVEQDFELVESNTSWA